MWIWVFRKNLAVVLLGVFSKGHSQLGCTPCGQGAPLGAGGGGAGGGGGDKR